ncbi:MAG: nuclear transport factor 2 family protein [Vicinamibacterales bacterium]
MTTPTTCLARANGVLASLLALSVAVSAGCARGADQAPADPPDDPAAVLALEGGAAMALAEQGFDAYAALFHPDYTNWSGGERVLDRAAFLAAVRAWYDAGNHAVCAALHPLSVDIAGDIAYSRYLMREEFNDGTIFVGRFASLARRDDGRWRLYRTSFSTVFRGAPADAPPGLVPAGCAADAGAP